MRQLLLSVLAAACFFTVHAAGTTATLQQGDSVKAFYGENAFISAYAAAADSAVITLSGGNFAFPDSIAKSITVIGNGAFSDNTLSPNTNITNTGTVYISADNVTLEGIKYSANDYIKLKNISDCRIKRCYISNLGDDNVYYNKNTIVEDSYIVYFDAMYGSENLYINNCAIGHFYDCNSKDKLATIENTNVQYIDDHTNDNKLPYAIYRNCNLGYYYYNLNEDRTVSLYTPSEYYNVNILIGKRSNCSYSLFFGSGLKYENVVIVKPDFYFSNWPSFLAWSYRGPIDHKANPSIPRITSSTVDTKTDGEGKLNIKLKVAVQD